MGIQVGDNSLIDVVPLYKRMRSSLNPDFRYSGAGKFGKISLLQKGGVLSEEVLDGRGVMVIEQKEKAHRAITPRLQPPRVACHARERL